MELGGDLVALGPHPDGSAWRVGIQHPREPGRAIASVDLARGALATSGDCERGFERDGRRYHHILDPRTGWPAQGLASVSVITDRCLIAGTASTVGMLKGAADGPRWLAELSLPYLCVDSAVRQRELRP